LNKDTRLIFCLTTPMMLKPVSLAAGAGSGEKTALRAAASE